eukprot:evm.model.NODE_27792_length_1335_cov_15.353558.1
MEGFEDIDWGVFDDSPPNLLRSSAADVSAVLSSSSQPSSSSSSSFPAKGSLALSRPPPHHQQPLAYRQCSGSPAPSRINAKPVVNKKLATTALAATTSATIAEAGAPTSFTPSTKTARQEERAKMKDKDNHNDDNEEEEEVVVEEEEEEGDEEEEEAKGEVICQGKKAATSTTLPPTPTTATQPRKGKGTGPILQTSMPLVFPSAAQRQKDGLGLLVSMNDKAFECAGDTGALGRCTIIPGGREGGQERGRERGREEEREGGQQQMEALLRLDLKGVEYVGR